MSTIKEKTIELIDALKATCKTYGMGNDGNEYKIITQVFLYKFLNDKFGYEVKNAKSDIAKKIRDAEKWEMAYAELSDTDRMLLQSAISPDVPMLEPYHLISNLWNQQGKGDFDTIFDSTMTDIAEQNADIFSTQTTANTKIPLFEPLTQFVTDSAQRAPFARALVDKLANFSFEEAFVENYDFFSNIFEYLIFQSLAIIQNAIGSKNTAPYNLIFAAVFRLPSASITANNLRLNTPTSMKKIVTKNISYHFRLKVFLKHINHMYTISPANVRIAISACWDIHARISFNVSSPSS